MGTRTPVLVLLVAAVLSTAATATAQDVTCSSTLQFTSGTYIFTEPTRTLTFNNGVTVALGRLRLSASLPAIAQNSGAVTLVGGAALPTGGQGHGSVGRRQPGQEVPMGQGGSGGGGGSDGGGGGAGGGGQQADLWDRSLAVLSDALQVDSLVREPGSYDFRIGDPLAGITLDLYHGFGLLRALSLTSSVKAPLNALDSGVGTGEWDAGAGAAAAFGAGRVLVFIDASYWWYGDLPELELDDGLTAGAGVAFAMGRVWASATATASNRIIGTAEPPRSVTAALSYRAGDAGLLSIMAGFGLSETAPDYAVSIGWTGALPGS